MRLTDLLNLSTVPRWTIVPHLRPQSVSDHTFRLCVIARELADRLRVELMSIDYWSMLTHDGAESRSGDIPTPYKRLLGHAAAENAEALACPWTTYGDNCFSGDNARTVFALADLIEAHTFIYTWGIGTYAQ